MEEIQSYGGTGMFRKKLTIMVLVSILLTGCGAQVAEAEQEREAEHGAAFQLSQGAGNRGL